MFSILQIFLILQIPQSCKSLQFTNYPTAISQRGRRQGRSLKIRPHPEGVQGVPLGGALFWFLSDPSGFEGSGRSAPAAGPYPKVSQKVIKNRIRKNIRFLTPNCIPKGPSKSQKSHQICKMDLSNTFRELLWQLSFQKRVPSRPQGPPEPQK